MEIKLKLDKFGRITIPKPIRTSLNIEQGQHLRAYVSNEGLVILNQQKQKKQKYKNNKRGNKK